MKLRMSEFLMALSQRQALKVIAGIANFNLDHVLMIVRAASRAGATAIDVAARPDIVTAARQNTTLPLVASCVQPQNLLEAIHHGADVVELGNFDALYAQGLFLTAEDVLKLAEQTLSLVQGQALVSITIPGHLSMDTQIQMLKRLESMGVDIIQTEGASRILLAEPKIKELSGEEKALITLANTRTLSRETSLPILTASGLHLDNVTQAIHEGASGVGVGSVIRHQATEEAMVNIIQQLVLRLSTASYASREAQAMSLVS